MAVVRVRLIVKLQLNPLADERPVSGLLLTDMTPPSNDR